MNHTATVERRIARQRAEDLLRLASKGQQEGVRILVDHRTQQHVATSASDPTACYHVDRHGCTCKGFGRWGRCKHFALFLSEMGLIDTDPEPAPVTTTVIMVKPAACYTCGGRGEEYVAYPTYGQWERCQECEGRGSLIVAA